MTVEILKLLARVRFLLLFLMILHSYSLIIVQFFEFMWQHLVSLILLQKFLLMFLLNIQENTPSVSFSACMSQLWLDVSWIHFSYCQTLNTGTQPSFHPSLGLFLRNWLQLYQYSSYIMLLLHNILWQHQDLNDGYQC